MLHFLENANLNDNKRNLKNFLPRSLMTGHPICPLENGRKAENCGKNSYDSGLFRVSAAELVRNNEDSYDFEQGEEWMKKKVVLDVRPVEEWDSDCDACHDCSEAKATVEVVVYGELLAQLVARNFVKLVSIGIVL